MSHSKHQETVEHGSSLVVELNSNERPSERLVLRNRKTTIGSDRDCTMVLNSPLVQPMHCLVVKGKAGTIVRNFHPDTRLNGEQFGDHWFHANDALSVGNVDITRVDAGANYQSVFGSSSDEKEQTTAGRTEEMFDLIERLTKMESVVDQLKEVNTASRNRTRKILKTLRQRVESSENELAEKLDHVSQLETTNSELLNDLSRTKDEFVSAEDLERLAAEFEAKNEQLLERLESKDEMLRQFAETNSSLAAELNEVRSEPSSKPDDQQLTENLAQIEDDVNQDSTGIENSSDSVDDQPESAAVESSLAEIAALNEKKNLFDVVSRIDDARSQQIDQELFSSPSSESSADPFASVDSSSAMESDEDQSTVTAEQLQARLAELIESEALSKTEETTTSTSDDEVETAPEALVQPIDFESNVENQVETETLFSESNEIENDGADFESVDPSAAETVDQEIEFSVESITADESEFPFDAENQAETEPGTSVDIESDDNLSAKQVDTVEESPESEIGENLKSVLSQFGVSETDLESSERIANEASPENAESTGVAEFNDDPSIENDLFTTENRGSELSEPNDSDSPEPDEVNFESFASGTLSEENAFEEDLAAGTLENLEFENTEFENTGFDDFQLSEDETEDSSYTHAVGETFESPTFESEAFESESLSNDDEPVSNNEEDSVFESSEDIASVVARLDKELSNSNAADSSTTESSETEFSEVASDSIEETSNIDFSDLVSSGIESTDVTATDFNDEESEQVDAPGFESTADESNADESTAEQTTDEESTIESDPVDSVNEDEETESFSLPDFSAEDFSSIDDEEINVDSYASSFTESESSDVQQAENDENTDNGELEFNFDLAESNLGGAFSDFDEESLELEGTAVEYTEQTEELEDDALYSTEAFEAHIGGSPDFESTENPTEDASSFTSEVTEDQDNPFASFLSDMQESSASDSETETPVSGGNDEKDALATSHLFEQLSAANEETSDSSPAESESEIAKMANGNDGDSEDSYIHDYMQRLLGNAESEPVLKEDKPAKPSLLEQTFEQEIKERQEMLKPSEFIPKSSAPERNSNLAAMRELANQSARSAIETSCRKRKFEQQSTFILIASGVSFFLGACSAMFIKSVISLPTIGSAFFFTLAGFGAYYYLELKSPKAKPASGANANEQTPTNVKPAVNANDETAASETETDLPKTESPEDRI